MPLLFAEALVFVGLTVAFARFIDFGQSGVVSLLLAAAALRHRSQQLLDENRRRIWGCVTSPWPANARTVLSSFSTFLSVTAAYMVPASWLTTTEIQHSYDFTLACRDMSRHAQRTIGPRPESIRPIVRVLRVAGK